MRCTFRKDEPKPYGLYTARVDGTPCITMLNLILYTGLGEVMENQGRSSDTGSRMTKISGRMGVTELVLVRFVPQELKESGQERSLRDG